MKNVMHHSGNEFHSLFVGDLPHDCSDDTLQRLFQQKFKSVKRVQIIRNEDGSSRGFGFIRFEDQSEFRAALGQDMKIGNTSLRLDMAHTRESRHKNNRSRYNSFNSTGNNYNNKNQNNNHHHHQQQHYNHIGSGSNHNHHHNHQQQPNHHNQTQQQQPHHHQSQPHHGPHSHTQTNNMSTGNTTNNNKNNHNLNNQNTTNNKSLKPDSVGAVVQSQQPSLNIGGANSASSSTTTSNHHPISVTSPNSFNHQPPTHLHSNQNHYSLPQQQQPQQQHQKSNIIGNQTAFLDGANNTTITGSATTGPISKATLKNPSQMGGDVNNFMSQAKPHQQQHPKQAGHQVSSPVIEAQSQSQSQQQTPSVPLTQPPSSASSVVVSTSTIGVSHPNSNTTTSVSSSTTSSGSHNLNLSSGQPHLHHQHQGVGADLRAFPSPANMMDTHLLNSDQPSAMIPPTSVYGHMYSYGPPFGYLPTPQPSQVVPISGVPPVPPNQAPPSSAINHHLHQSHHHPQTHPHLAVQNPSVRYNTGHHHHNQQQHHPQQPLQSHHHSHQPHSHSHQHAHHQQQSSNASGTASDASGINANPGGVQAAHQGPPLYYYYPSPLYFDQVGAAPPHPNLYHTQPFHPQFFAMPNPAYMPGAHTTYNQPPQPSASQSDATSMMTDQHQQQQQPPQQPQTQPPPTQPQTQQQPPQPQVMRTRDIDTTIE